MALEIEREVHALLEESAQFYMNKDLATALEKARAAVKREKYLIKFREEKGITDQNTELSFSVSFNLARMYHVNSMYTEALDTYSEIVKNKDFANAGRVRINMGNIYFENKNYPASIKMYRMALDQTPLALTEVRTKITFNIAMAFVKIGQYNDAAQNFEAVVENSSDIEACFYLLVCYFAQGDKKEMKKIFKKLLNLQIPGMEFDQDLDDESYALMNDELRDYLKAKQKQHWDFILKGAKLIAEVVEDNWIKGYDYVIEQLRSYAAKKEKCNLAGEIEMAKALYYLKEKDFSNAIDSLKAFEKKEKDLKMQASTNLSFIFLLEGDLKNADKYARLAIDVDKYNAKALVNLGNCYFLKRDFEAAKSKYIEAIKADADCVEAIYNLGLATKELGQYDEAVAAFKRLHTIVPENVEVIHQIASVFTKMEDNTNSIDWYNRVVARVPTDPNVLCNLGTLYAKENDESQSFNCYLESYRYYPVIMDVISWLGLYFVKNDLYEKALQYFERATQIQPKEVNWQLMVASCYRRIGSYQQAKKCYEDIYQKYPDNLECLRYLVQICGELGLKKEKKHYSKELIKVEERLQRMKSKQPNEEDGPMEEDSLSQTIPSQSNNISKSNSNASLQDTNVTTPAMGVNDKRVVKDSDDEILKMDATSMIDSLYT